LGMSFTPAARRVYVTYHKSTYDNSKKIQKRYCTYSLDVEEWRWLDIKVIHFHQFY